ncbi:MAG: CHASE2 domain-containing protein [Elusimicrobia bacterium]|nr:CHASE2 domain-containing protein [Elusimicrobiota bacterium]
MRDRLLRVAPAAVLAAALGVQVWDPPALGAFRDRVFDFYQAAAPRPARPAPVRVVVIDDESLERFGRWPWPRTVLARALERLASLGVSTVALDVAFTGPDPSSPERLIERLPPSPERDALRRRLAREPSHDRMLARAFGKLRVVTGFFLSGEETGSRPAAKAGFARLGDDAAQFLPEYSGAIANLPELERVAQGSGGLSVLPESDGVMRRVPLVYRLGEELYPGFALEALRVWQGAEGLAVQASGSSGAMSFGHATGVARLRTGRFEIPCDAQGRVWVRYAAPMPERRVSVARLLEGGEPAGAWKGSLVFIGASAARLKDLFVTPVDRAKPGAEIHAEIAEQAMTGEFLRRPDWAKGAETLYLLAIGAALLASLPRFGPAGAGLVGLAFLGLAAGLSWAAFSARGFLIDPLVPAAAALAVYVVSSLVAHLRTEAERLRLEVLDRVKDEFVSTVSHDLRGPVNSMIMVTEMMLEGVYGPLTDKQAKYLTLIKESGRRLVGFVSNILDTAKMRAGKLEFHKSPVLLQEVVGSVIDLYETTAQARGLTLERSVPHDLPPVLADREKLEQVVNNLLGNAMKFTPSGKITLAAEREGAFARVSVTDTGAGIAPANLGKLFQKFQQLDVARQKEAGIVGTGLGLAICKAVVDAHGGRIWAESPGEGKGTSFRLTLPLAEEAARGSGPPAS